MPFEQISQRIKRYDEAKRERELKIRKFVEAYRMAFPTHAKWLIHGKGSESFDKTDFRWDVTAVQGVKTFASNIQSLLMPPFKQWGKLKAGAQYDASEADLINKELVQPSNILFTALNNSNLLLEADIAFQDMSIAVGLLQIHSTGNRRVPLRFQSIPMHTVALGSYQGKIKDVYRTLDVESRYISSIWPDAIISNRIKNIIQTSPNAKIKLLEGTIYYPENKPHERYLYFVTDMEGQHDLVNRSQFMSRWIPFRFAVSPGEVWGDGPVLQILDSIRIANKIHQMDLLNGGMKIAKPLFINGKKILNPNNIKMEPGALIHVNDTAPGELPIVPLDIAGDFQFDQITLESYQAEIREALFADPLGPAQRPNQSATETSIRQQNWLKKSASSLGRLSNELLQPIILKSLILLQEQGFLTDTSFKIDPDSMDMTISGEDVDIEFMSPLANLENRNEAQNFLEFNQEMQSILGPNLSVAALNIPEIPQYLASKMNINPNLVKGEAEIKELQQQLAENQQQQQEQAMQAAQQNNLPTPTTEPEETESQPNIPQLNLTQG